MPAPYQRRTPRETCKYCEKPNDREFEGSLGGLVCKACISERRLKHERFARAEKRTAILARGGRVCSCGRRAIPDGHERCTPCTDRILRLTQAVAPTEELGGERCKRCYLRGPHECLTGLETRRSSWANIER